MGYRYAILVVLAVVGFAYQGPYFRTGRTIAVLPVREAKNRIRIPAKRPTKRKGRFPSGFG